jgi:MFS family permease
MLTMLAVPWFVLETTGSAAKTGLTGFFATLPVVIATFFGGAIVDRLGFKRVSVAADVASGITVALIPFLYYTTGLAFWQLLVLVFLGAFLDAPGTTARQSLLPDLAKMADMRLERANASYQAIQRFSALAGPPLAGALIVLLGASRVLWVDAATFAISAALIGLTAPRAPVGKETSHHYLCDLAEGFRFVRQDRLVLSIVATVAITNFLDSPLFAVVMPVYANRVLGSAADLGLAVAGFGASSLLASIVFGMIGHRLPRRATFVSAFIAVGLPFWVLATLPPFWIVVAALSFSGLASGPLNPILMTVGQERVPAAMRGRVFGMISGLVYVAMPLGIAGSGYVVEELGLSASLVIIAAGYLAVTVGQLFNPALHEMARPAKVSQEVSAKPA